MIIVGVDPGGRGGFAWIADTGSLIKMAVMPTVGKETDESGIVHLLKGLTVDHIFIEHAQPMPKQGNVSMFRYGVNFGIIRGIAAGLHIPFTLVKPTVWQKEMFQGTDAMMKTKQRGLVAAKRLWPVQDWLASPRSTVPHDGLFDACLIGEWGRRRLKL